MTIEDIGRRLNLSASGARALVEREGWQPVGKVRTSRKGPRRDDYAPELVEEYAKRRAAELRAEADGLEVRRE